MNFQFQIRNYKKKNGTQAIRLRFFTSSNDIQYLDTGISVLKNQWDNKKQTIKKHPLEEKLNASLNALLNEVKSLYYKNQGISAKRLLQIYRNSKKYDSSSFFTFYQSIIDEMRLKGKTRTARSNQLSLVKLQKFSSYLSFSDISPLWAKDYERWMLDRGNKTNTIASNFKAIKAVLGKAIKAGIITNNPLKGFDIKEENTQKEHLTIEEITLIENSEFAPRFKSMNLAKDMFLFSFYTAGMRFTDMCKLKWENITNTDIIYTMNKSSDRAGSRRFIPLNKKSIGILNKYRSKTKTFVFPVLDGFRNLTNEEVEYKIHIANNKLNRGLKLVAKHLSINKRLTMHIGKHSFADYMVKNDVNLLLISKLLGHSKLATTQHYLKDFYHKEESDVMNRLFDDEDKK